MANQITVNSGSGNITVTTSRAVIGTVANVASANYANFAGEVVDPSQPNITSLGNLTNLNVTGTTTTGNLVVQGNLQVGNLVANTANFANFAGTAFAVAGANVSGAVANATFATTAGSANTANSATVANSANAVAGANVSGTVANAAYADNAGNANFANSATVASSANSVTLANVSGAGNIASINLDGSSSNVLRGDGTFAPEGSSGNANYANFAGTAFSVSGSNVSGTVANATFAANAGAAFTANTANSATVANSANSVTLANVSGAGNIASINLDGSTSNVLYGNGIFAPAAGGNTANANYANFAGNAFSVDGSNVVGAVANATFALDAGNANIANIAYSVDGANVSGAVANATFALDAGNANIANIAYSVDGANVSGAVANATFALDAGNANIANIAYSVDAANVSGLGNIATINLDGNVSNLLTGNGTFVAIPTGGSSNFANFAGEVTNSAQPNITSVGTLTALNANTSTPISIVGGNGNLEFRVLNSSNAAGRRVAFAYDNPTTNLAVVLGADETGFGYYMSNTAPGNVGTGNIRSYWQFLPSGDFRHTLGGTGNITAKNLILANVFTGSVIGNVSAGNVTANAGTITANGAGFVGNAAGLTNIPGANVTGFVPNANVANFAGNVVNSAQPNITSVGNLTSLTVTGNLNANVVNANYLYGDGSNISNLGGGSSIQNGNSIVDFTGVDGDLNISTNNVTNGVQVSGRTIFLNGVGEQPPSNSVYSQLNVFNGAVQVTQDNIGGGLASFSFTQYENTNSFLNPYTFYRARGNTSSPQAVANGDTVMNQGFIVYGDSGNTFVGIGTISASVNTNDGAGNVSGRIDIGTQNNNDGSRVELNSDIINLVGNVTTPYDINVNSGNVIIGANGRLDYLRTFGSFTSNATQTSNGANTTNYMTLNNTEDANGISIASSTQITVARTGRYNIQFSAQVEKTDSGTDLVEIWLDKNGTNVPNSATQLELQGSGAKEVAAWDFNVDAANVNDYFRLAWASPDTNVQLTAITSANTISGVAVPSLIVDVNPIGA